MSESWLHAPGDVPIVVGGVVIDGSTQAALHEDEAVAQAGADAIIAVLDAADGTERTDSDR